MYYDKKSTFYFKQYGPAVIVVIVSLLLLSMGVFIYLETSKPKDPNQSANNQVSSSTSDAPNYNLDDMSAVFNNVEKGSMTKEYKVVDVKDVSKIVIEIENGKATEINLIGVKAINSNNTETLDSILNKIKTDLLNNNIKLSFDGNKAEDNKIYAYVYLNDALYNETILKDGSGELRVEKHNINKLDVLLAAEKYARANRLGLWK